MYIHKEIISIIILILVIFGFAALKFFLDFKRLGKIIKSLSKNNLTAKDFFFFHQFESLIFNLSGYLRHHEEKLRSMKLKLLFYDKFFNSFPDPLFIIDEKNNIVELNQRSKNLIDEEAVGKNINSVLRIPNLGALIETSLFTKKPQKSTLSLIFPTEIIYDVWVSGSSKVGGRKLNFIRLYDCTSENKAKELQTEFIANVSHELKTPISAISGYCETLLGVGKDDDEVREKFLNILKNESSRMASLVNDLLSLTRIERIEHSPPDDTIEIVGLLKDSINVSNMSYPKSKKIKSFKFPQKKIMIIGDYNELKQVFINIIDNAIKYGAGSKLPEVKLLDNKDNVKIIVRDFGLGIEPQNIPMLTNRFYRVDSSRSRDLGSTGLGLSIVKHILNRHKAEFEIKSKVNEGSSFIVNLKKLLVS